MTMITLIKTLLMIDLCQSEVAINTSPAEHGHGSCLILDGVFVSVMRRIFNPGFHKELVSEVEVMLTTTLLPDSCTLLMEETMPRGAYADPDQLRELRYTRGLRAFVPTKVDIEKPEFDLGGDEGAQ